MPLQKTYPSLRRFIAASVICSSAMLCSTMTIAQSENGGQIIDPRLVEIVQIVKARTSASTKTNLLLSEDLTQDEIYINLLDRMMTAAYSQKSDVILQATENFKQTYQFDAAIDLSRIQKLYKIYSELLTTDEHSKEVQVHINELIAVGNWFEKYVALSLSAHLHATAKEQQSALQKAQLALSIIPTKSDSNHNVYIIFARARVVSLIAQLHNLQGNSDLALATSLDYLRLTKDNPDLKTEVDLINNLIYSYSIGRNHEAQLYLSEQLLELEQTQSL